MSDSRLDLTDPAVRAMAEANHLPEEVWSLAGRLVALNCQTCGHAWPCPTSDALGEDQ